jgi:alkaline phosphatase D
VRWFELEPVAGRRAEERGMRRRDFLKGAGYVVVSASLPRLLACGDDDATDDAADGDGDGEYSFPQGVASGDPQPTAIMLWTRVARSGDSDADIELTLEVSTTRDFESIVVSERLVASADGDFTVRVLATELEPATTYHYRFRAGETQSRVGRTRTAPEHDADVDVRFVWASCQDYASGFYGAYRQLLNDDADLPEDEQIQFVLHLGDFIYETRNAGFMQALNEDLEPIELVSKDGTPRLVGEFPSGGGELASGASFAQNLDDYRHIYRTYLHDPDLQEARARWPFICVWDDHEFSDDCWQTQANYTREATTDEPSQERRLAASQAWSEYIPSALDDLEAIGDVDSNASDFVTPPVEVEDAPYTDVIEVNEPNSERAIDAITIYRRLRFGRHVDLVLTDSRSYRSDHALAEELTAEDLLSFHPRAALPKDAVNIADAGQTANGGDPPDKAGKFDNLRASSLPGTLLGEAQKRWWKDVMERSDASWKIWGNSVPLLRILLDASEVELIPEDLLLSPDAWDGYNTERKELMAFLKENAITNVVSLSGDHHAHYAGLVYDDHDAAAPSPVMIDLVTAGISSTSQFAEIAGAFDNSIPEELASLAESVRQVIVYDSTKYGGTDKAVVNMNTLIRYGSAAANVAAQTNDLDQVEAARNPDINPQLRFADAGATGYGVAHVTADAMRVRLVTVERSERDLEKSSPGIRGEAAFTIPHVASLADVALAEPELTGEKPFPLR